MTAPYNSRIPRGKIPKRTKKKADELRAAGSTIKVIDYLTEHNGSTRSQVMEGTDIAGDSFDTAIKYLTRLVTIKTGAHGRKFHTLDTHQAQYRKAYLLNPNDKPEQEFEYLDKGWVAFDNYTRLKYGIPEENENIEYSPTALRTYSASHLTSNLTTDKIDSIVKRIRAGDYCHHCTELVQERYRVSNKLEREEVLDRRTHITRIDVIAVLTERRGDKCGYCDKAWEPDLEAPQVKPGIRPSYQRDRNNFGRLGSRGPTKEKSPGEQDPTKEISEAEAEMQELLGQASPL